MNKDKCCYYSFKKKKYCEDLVSRVDPEHKFCSKHRRCVYPAKTEKEKNPLPEEEKLSDYMTFKLMCLENYI